MMRHKLQNILGSPKLTTKLNKCLLMYSATNNYVSLDMYTNYSIYDNNNNFINILLLLV